MTGTPDTISHWDTVTQERDMDAPFEGDCTTTLAIIGGGFTGLSTALHAAADGHDCHVLEAQRIGHGGSGRNVGLVNAGLWLPPQDVAAKLGKMHGPRLLQVLGDAPDTVFRLIEKYQIRCDAVRSGTIHAAHSPKGLADLRRRAEGWHALGVPVELLDAEEAAQKIGSRAFHGGLLDPRAGIINPMGYARGLARAARAEGARISTGVRVTGLRREGGLWRVRTTQGTLSAPHVVLATNGYSDDLWPGLSRVFTPINFFQLATEPLGERAAHILPEGQGMWDTGTIMFALRRDAEGRIVIGSMGALIGGESGLSERWARKRLGRLFPDLGAVRFEARWQGIIALTPDHVPRIHRLAEGLYAPIGYNGRGIAPGTIFGRAMAGLLSGARDADLPLPVTDLKSVPNRAFMTRFYAAAFAANQLFKSV